MVEKEHKYYDLNLILSEPYSITNPNLLKLIESCIIDGYKGFAISHFKRAPIIEKELINISKLDIVNVMKDTISKSLTLREKMDWDFTDIEQYSRITIEISDQKHITTFMESSKIYKMYDVIAVRPTTEKLFQQCCSQVGILWYFLTKTYKDCDIISLDLSEKLGFYFKKQNIWEAISRGVSFEICYGKALTDSAKRQILLRNATALAEICKGKNLIISSEVGDYISHRSPMDLKMMSELMGIEEKYRNKVLEENTQNVIFKAKNRKIYKGVLQITKPEELEKVLEKEYKENPELKDKIISKL